jgi:hypothetical protein
MRRLAGRRTADPSRPDCSFRLRTTRHWHVRTTFRPAITTALAGVATKCRMAFQDFSSPVNDPPCSGPSARPMTIRRDFIAIVDDDPGTLKALTRLLSTHGYRAEPYASAQEFLGSVGTTKAQPALDVGRVQLRSPSSRAIPRSGPWGCRSSSRAAHRMIPCGGAAPHHVLPSRGEALPEELDCAGTGDAAVWPGGATPQLRPV